MLCQRKHCHYIIMTAGTAGLSYCTRTSFNHAADHPHVLSANLDPFHRSCTCRGKTRQISLLKTRIKSCDLACNTAVSCWPWQHAGTTVTSTVVAHQTNMMAVKIQISKKINQLKIWILQSTIDQSKIARHPRCNVNNITPAFPVTWTGPRTWAWLWSVFPVTRSRSTLLSASWSPSAAAWITTWNT